MRGLLTPSSSTRDPVAQWKMGPSGRIIYPSVAGVVPNDPLQSGSESAQRLWRDPLSSSATSPVERPLSEELADS